MSAHASDGSASRQAEGPAMTSAPLGTTHVIEWVPPEVFGHPRYPAGLWDLRTLAEFMGDTWPTEDSWSYEARCPVRLPFGTGTRLTRLADRCRYGRWIPERLYYWVTPAASVQEAR
jgi:hypothetical protein